MSNEMKIALCHLLLKYDFRLVPGQSIKPSFEIESNVLFHPQAEWQFKRRQEEINVDLHLS